MIHASTVTFSDRASAQLFELQSWSDLSGLPEMAELPQNRPVLVLVGGASRLSEADFERVRRLFVEGLAAIAQKFQAVVIDGGTDTGVMKLMGQARAELNATFPLVGVCPKELATLPNQSAPNQSATSEEAAPLEPNHTHFFLVPGDRWGDEAEWLAKIASEIASTAPSVAVLINGGEISWKDTAENLNVGRSVVAIAGSGRTADLLAAALNEDSDPRAKPLIATGLVRTSKLSDGSAALAQIIEEIFLSRE